MSEKKFISGGFPGIRYCIDEKNIITKESREKREFAVRKIIPISQILTNRISDNVTNLTESLNFKDSINYENTEEHFMNINNQTKLKLINKPVKTKRSKRKSKK